MELVKGNIENKIYTIRGIQVMLDSDLAELYNSETKIINRAVKRNYSRFPEAFAFQLTEKEWENLRFQFGTSSLQHGGRRYPPRVFTEQCVTCTVHTRIKPVLQKDLEKHNKQYEPITLIENKGSHDRFLILDNQELYHIGASLKDLGNKCFAFSRMDDFLEVVKVKLLNG